MKKNRLIVLLIASTILVCHLASCTKEVDFTGEQSNPFLVVNGLQQAGQPASLRVEKSVFFLDDQPDRRVKDVEVDLYVNGIFKESLQVRDSSIMEQYYIWTEEGEIFKERLRYAFNYCEGQYVICDGDQLRFEVRSSEFDNATAEVTVPQSPQVISFDTVRTEVSPDDYEVKLRFALQLNDPAGNNYYNLYPKDALSSFTSSDPAFTDLTAVDDIENLFGENEYYGRGQYNLFTDKFFDGSEYTLTMETNWYLGEGYEYYQEPFTLEVTCMDSNFYQYFRSYRAFSNSDPESLIGMFTEPVQVYSNVKNAVGVVAAQSQPVVVSVDLSQNGM